MTHSEPVLLYSRDGRVARITFNRPLVLNAIEVEMAGRAAGQPVGTGHNEASTGRIVVAALGQQLTAERETFDACVAPADFTEALNACVEKRPVDHKGR